MKRLLEQRKKDWSARRLPTKKLKELSRREKPLELLSKPRRLLTLPLLRRDVRRKLLEKLTLKKVKRLLKNVLDRQRLRISLERNRYSTSTIRRMTALTQMLLLLLLVKLATSLQLSTLRTDVLKDLSAKAGHLVEFTESQPTHKELVLWRLTQP